ncbi:GNAT family N-acetyltransferase [Alkalimonas amylolytica]|uniref:tRNA(Met) cytidine acetyltransferase TmcA n=1 Tax=Alkalimonas amylolytica TaxID=152573 RepID=A0A1H4EGE7_ALKAM|nr:GNAT family N-acetyltransferase [Alkalimonas amylolytica]SEA83899.1 tRNA(Met) cytidine acetyltransferase [Alkalimonas amylolytica]
MLGQQLPDWLSAASAAHCRLPVVFSGSNSRLLPQVQQLLQHYQPDKLCWIGPGAPAGALVPSRQHKHLGTECDWLIINAEQGFPADLVAAVSGSIKAGGLWLLLMPEPEQWIKQPNSDHRHLLPYPLDAAKHQGDFLRFFYHRLQQCSLAWLTPDEVLQAPSFSAAKASEPAPAPYASTEQQAAVAAIHKVALGHRKRPLVLTAHRGRGKSAALGLAAAELAQHDKQILLTAPNESAAAICQQHFAAHTGTKQQALLRFLPIDVLLKQQPHADVVLVDEAAAIPTPLLQQLVQAYPRVVFATTEHGYEGTGRGFQLRFQAYLQQHFTGYKQLQLKQPIRYADGDPLEHLLFHSLLLNLSEQDPVWDGAIDALQLLKLSSGQLLKQPELLQSLFHLLSLAHYQTRVDDLAALLDNSQLEMFALLQDDDLLACALISLEGELPELLSKEILLGKRRVQGHLLAQSLAFHLQQPELTQQPMARIQRIVVHPTLQGQGLGTELLNRICAHYQQAERLIGTSFAVSTQVLRFWLKAGFVPVRLGIKADQASGEHSLLMLQQSDKHHSRLQQLESSFRHQLYDQIPAFYPELSPALLKQLVTPPQQALSQLDYQALILFADQQRPFELVYSQLLLWFNQHVQDVPAADAEFCIALFWQKKGFDDLAKRFGFTGKKQLIGQLRRMVATALTTPGSA